MKKYKESVDGDGNIIHFVPVKCHDVKGYRIVDGPSPPTKESAEKHDKRKIIRAKRKKKNKMIKKQKRNMS